MGKQTTKSSEKEVMDALEQRSKDENGANEGAGLDTLRDILFGPQVQATDSRMDGMERSLLQTKKDLSSTIKEEISSLRTSAGSQLKSARQELEWQLEKQNSEQSANLHTLQEEQKLAVDKLANDFDEKLQSTQKQLIDRLDDLGDTLSERLLEMQADFRRRDDELRQQILTLTDWLDERKASREDLSDLLIDMGKELQKTKKTRLVDTGHEESE